ncbi:uncharacterized protein V1516DRAFT_684802 [Lipomyces oligophaga]|uniref:uncharacterized protein n=1 Tax=Lipomyces oligophaga TaxID=45792 RepID=UPI0034CDF93C
MATTNQDQGRRVYVGNLAYNVEWTQLKDIMRQAGNVLYVEVLYMANGKSKGCAIVEYADPADAANAIATLSDLEINGRRIFVREDREAERPAQRARPMQGGPIGYPAGNAPTFQVFVGNLPFDTEWRELKDLCRQVANPLWVDIQTGPDGRPRGSGIIAFGDISQAKMAIARLNNFELRGRRLLVHFDRFAGQSLPPRRGNFSPSGNGGTWNGTFNSSGQVPSAPVLAKDPNPFTDGAGGNGVPSNIIYVANLPWSTVNEDLIDLFQTIGKVVRAEIQMDFRGRSNGAGVVEFENQEIAEFAINKFNNYNYGNRPLRISYVNYQTASFVSVSEEPARVVEAGFEADGSMVMDDVAA